MQDLRKKKILKNDATILLSNCLGDWILKNLFLAF